MPRDDEVALLSQEEETPAIECNRQIEMGVGIAETPAVILLFVFKQFFPAILEGLAHTILLPYLALASLLRAILQIREACLETSENKTSAIVRAVVETLTALAILTAVVGTFIAGTIFAIVGPINFTIAFSLKTLFHLGATLYYGLRALVSQDPRQKPIYTAKMKVNGVFTLFNAASTVAVGLVFIAHKATYGILGIVSGVVGTAFAVYKGCTTKMARSPQLRAISEASISLQRPHFPHPDLPQPRHLKSAASESNLQASLRQRQPSVISLPEGKERGAGSSFLPPQFRRENTSAVFVLLELQRAECESTIPTAPECKGNQPKQPITRGELAKQRRIILEKMKELEKEGGGQHCNVFGNKLSKLFRDNSYSFFDKFLFNRLKWNKFYNEVNPDQQGRMRELLDDINQAIIEYDRNNKKTCATSNEAKSLHNQLNEKKEFIYRNMVYRLKPKVGDHDAFGKGLLSWYQEDGYSSLSIAHWKTIWGKFGKQPGLNKEYDDLYVTGKAIRFDVVPLVHEINEAIIAYNAMVEVHRQQLEQETLESHIARHQDERINRRQEEEKAEKDLKERGITSGTALIMTGGDRAFSPVF